METIALDIQPGSKIPAFVQSKTGSGLITVQIEPIVVPDILWELSDSNYNPQIYTDSTVSKIGLTPESLQFLSTDGFKKVEESNAECTDCKNAKEVLNTFYNLKNFGQCYNGWCQYQKSGCYYDIRNNFWYRCLPKVKGNLKKRFLKRNIKIAASRSNRQLGVRQQEDEISIPDISDSKSDFVHADTYGASAVFGLGQNKNSASSQSSIGNHNSHSTFKQHSSGFNYANVNGKVTGGGFKIENDNGKVKKEEYVIGDENDSDNQANSAGNVVNAGAKSSSSAVSSNKSSQDIGHSSVNNSVGGKNVVVSSASGQSAGGLNSKSSSSGFNYSNVNGKVTGGGFKIENDNGKVKKEEYVIGDENDSDNKLTNNMNQILNSQNHEYSYTNINGKIVGSGSSYVNDNGKIKLVRYKIEDGKKTILD
ncbi:hypothetical protein BB561_004635 [Smittium simulii]|uniref:Uncharacterized protein n=1 Tax=Smittium simulii TaxID=133385 RepID=A0A2T9YF54_9FUNG|nr:hypothetical protein BB561_004635 [Smittium simulii]